MARNLSRNTELFISTEVGGISVPDPTNLFEVKVLDGYSFSQDVANVEIGVNEAGETPARGTQAFNTALNPVDVSFSTYVRPYSATEDITDTTNAFADCVERVLWASAMGTTASWVTVTGTGAAANNVITAQDGTQIDFGLSTSNDNALMPVTLYFKLENTTYVIEDFNVSTAEIDFSIDGIATINWSGQGSTLTESPSWNDTIDGYTAGQGNDYKGVPTTSAASFLRNKLSVLTLKNNITETATDVAVDIASISGTGNTLTCTATTFDSTYIGGRVENNTLGTFRSIVSVTSGLILVLDDSSEGEDLATEGWLDTHTADVFLPTQDAGIVYDIPITGATITLENNFTYLTPEELAIVNQPLAGFAGNRVVSGSLTAYLNTGAAGSGGLLQDMLAKVEASVSNNYELVFKMGGVATDRRVEFTLPVCQLSVPTTNVEDVISTEIAFVSKPYTGASQAAAVGSFEATNEMTISYFD